MREIIYSICVLTLFSFTSAQNKDACPNCVRKDQCSFLRNMNPTEQSIWISEYPCMNLPYNSYYAIYNRGNYVCCTENLYYNFIRRYGVSNNIYGYPGEDNSLNNKYTTPPLPVYPPVNYPRPHDPGVSNVMFPEEPMVNVNGGVVGLTTSRPIAFPALPVVTGGRSQCQASSFPPSPESGCCGFEASEADRINVVTTARPANPQRPYTYYPEQSPESLDIRTARNAKNEFNHSSVSIDNRIAGGSATDFFQFPWTVQLISTFDYGQRRQSFDCGGSLISSRYILTAGHCVFDAQGTLVRVQAYLAEYDRTTFPDDCRTMAGVGQQCIRNVVIEGEEVIRHTQYDDDNLLNDIALIRLREFAPYTAFIRPICLTPIDVDDTNLANLRLSVAGWGRNGRFKSNIKQSTVVNLVPQEQCKKYYPTLLRRQMCAVGYTGEDTCKGDSGGPLMTVNNQKHYVVGIVSGKRADAPCGTAVPSLYTNVYQYFDWIFNNIRN